MEEEGRIPPELVKTLARYGFFGVVIPEQLGGSGQGLFDVVLTVEALARADAAVALLVDVHNTLVAAAINRFGRRSQRLRFLPKLASDCLGALLAFGVPRPEATPSRSGPPRSKSRGGFRLSGSKSWVSGGRESRTLSDFRPGRRRTPMGNPAEGSPPSWWIGRATA